MFRLAVTRHSVTPLETHRNRAQFLVIITEHDVSQMKDARKDSEDLKLARLRHTYETSMICSEVIIIIISVACSADYDKITCHGYAV